MSKQSTGHRLAVKRGVAGWAASRPLNILAKAMKVPPTNLRARFGSRGVKVRGASFGALVDALTDKERSQHGARIRKLMQRPPAPAADEPRPLHSVRSPDHTPESAGDLVPDVRLALAGLYRAARALGPAPPDQQDKVRLGIAEAINALRGTPAYKPPKQ